MPDINQVGGIGVQPQSIEQQSSVRAAEAAPAELREAKPSRLAFAGRVLLGIFTLGISEGIRALIGHARADRAPEPRAPESGLPAAEPRADAANQELAGALRNGTALPRAHESAVKDALSGLTRSFGEDLLPKKSTLASIEGSSVLKREIANAVAGAGNEVTPGDLRAIVEEKVSQHFAKALLVCALDDSCEKLGYEQGRPEALADRMLRDIPELKESLIACRDRASAQEAIGYMLPYMEHCIQAESDNHALAREISSGSLDALPAEAQAAIAAGVNDLRASFGEDIVPQGATLAGLPGADDLREGIAQAVSGSEARVEAGSLRSIVAQKGARQMAEAVFAKSLGECCGRLGYAARNPERLPGLLLRGFPEFAAELRAAANREGAEAVIAKHLPVIEANVRVRKEVDEALAGIKPQAVQQIAAKTGLTEEAVRQSLDFEKLQDRATMLSSDFKTGKRSGENNAVKNEFKAIVDRFADSKARLYNTAESLPLAPGLKEAWKSQALTEHTLSKGDFFETCYRCGSSVKADSLIQALQAPAGMFEVVEIYGLFDSLAVQVTGNLMAHYGPQAWFDLGGDGQGDARSFALQAMMNSNPGFIRALSKAVAERPGLSDSLQALCAERSRTALADRNAPGADEMLCGALVVRELLDRLSYFAGLMGEAAAA